MLADGVEIHEARNKAPDELRKQDKAPFGTTKSTLLQAKSFVIDRSYVFIGSLNFEPRSFTENIEISIVFDSAAFAGILARWFDEEIDSAAYALAPETNANGRDRLVWNHGDSAVLRKEADTSLWTRTLTRIMRWLPGESQLFLGPIKSTADYIATTMLLRGDGTEPTATFLNSAVYSAATSFSTTWHLAQSNDIEIPYWGSHVLSIQRQYATLCLLYGSDPSGQAHIVADLELPEDRAAGCPTEYAMAEQCERVADRRLRGKRNNGNC